MEIRQRNQMESEELLILYFQTDWTSLTEINLLPTWGLCSLHWAPHSIHGEPLFGSPRQTHRSQEGSVVVGCVPKSQAQEARMCLACGLILEPTPTKTNSTETRKRVLQGLSNMGWN